MAKCFMCGTDISNHNKSTEHILLNAIGGKLKSRDLICKDCNSNFGNESDATLARQLQFFVLMLDLPRERNETLPLTVIRTKSNEKVLMYAKGRLEMGSPSVNKYEKSGKQHYRVVARSQKELDRIFSDIKRKHPSASVLNTGKEIENVNELVRVEYDLGGGGLLSVCKTAICYYLYSGYDKEHITKAIDKLKNKDIYDICNFCYLEKPAIKMAEESIYHSIAIVGDPQRGVLYVCVELFNFYRVLVLLDDNYEGIEIRDTYCYDLLRRTEVGATIMLDLSKKEIANILNEELPDYAHKLVRELNKVKNDIEAKNTVERVCVQIKAKYHNQYGDNVPSEIFIKEFAEGIVREYMPYIKHKHENEE